MSKARFGIDVLLEKPWPVAGRRIGLITNASGVTAAGVPTWKALRDRAERAARASLRARARPRGRRRLHGGGRRRRSTRPRACRSSRSTARRRRACKPAARGLRGPRGDRLRRRRTSGAATTPTSGRCCSRWRPARARGCASSSATGPTRSAARSRARRSRTGYLTFVGLHPIPVRHGMTAGELARLFAAERRLDLDLVVCPAAGWARDMPFERDGPALGRAVAEHADGRHRARLSGHVPARGHEPLRGARARRGRSRSSARRGSTRVGAHRGAERPRAAGRSLPADAVPADVRQARRARRAAARSIHVTDRAAFRPFQTGLRVIEAARRLAPARLPLAHRALRVRRPAGDRPADRLATASARRVERGREPARPRSRATSTRPRPFRTRREPLPALSGPQARRRRVRRRPRLRQDVDHRRARPAAEGARACAVGTIKHTTRDVEDDVAGKDSQRHAAAGARGRRRSSRRRRTTVAALRRRGAARDGPARGSSRTATSSSSRATSRCRSRRSRSCGPGIARPDVIEPAARISDGPVLGLGADALLRRLGRDRRDRAARAPGSTARTVDSANAVPEVGCERPAVPRLRPRRHAHRRLRRDRRRARPTRWGGWACRRCSADRVRGMVGHGLESLLEEAVGAERAAEGVRLFRERYPRRRGREVAPAAGRRRGARDARPAGPSAWRWPPTSPRAFSRMILEAKGVGRALPRGRRAGRGHAGQAGSRRCCARSWRRPARAPDDTIVVGDMEVDFEFARAAGCRVVLIPGGSRSREELAARGRRRAARKHRRAAGVAGPALTRERRAGQRRIRLLMTTTFDPTGGNARAGPLLSARPGLGARGRARRRWRTRRSATAARRSPISTRGSRRASRRCSAREASSSRRPPPRPGSGRPRC